MKRLLFVTNESSHGGAERMLIWVANSLAKYKDYKVIFCNLNNKKTFYPLDENVELVLFQQPANENFVYRNTIGFVKKTFFLRSVIKDKKIDLVVNFNDHAIYNILMCKLLTGIKVLISQRVDPGSIKSKTGRFRLKLLNLVDGLVCQTQTAMDFFNKNIQRKSIVIFNPVYNKPSEVWDLEKTDDIIINVARLELKQKRQDVLIKAFNIVHKKYPNIRLLMYGSKIEEDYNEIMKLIRELELGSCVKYCGVSENIFEEMRKAKMLVLSSDYEGIPNAVLEAMSLGMPIVSTDCKPGGARMLLSNECGIIVRCDDVTALSEGMMSLYENRELACRLGKNALSSIERFDEIKIAEKWKEYIDILLK